MAHIYFLIGVRTPVVVAMQWLWSYLTFKKGARLITGLRPLFETPADKTADETSTGGDGPTGSG